MGKYRHELQKFNSFDGFVANIKSKIIQADLKKMGIVIGKITFDRLKINKRSFR